LRHRFTLNAQWPAAGRQDAHARGAAQDAASHGGRRLNDVCAIVQHEEHLLAAKLLNQGRDRIVGERLLSLHGCQCARHQARVAKLRQIDQPDAMLESAATASATARATEVFSPPPSPTMVTKPSCDNCAASCAITYGVGSANPLGDLSGLWEPFEATGCSSGKGGISFSTTVTGATNR
jgi:hypothetical protein